MKFWRFHSTDLLPAEYRDPRIYFVASNDHEICTGNRLMFEELPDAPVTVKALWLVIGAKILEYRFMEKGHDYIVRFDRSIGRVMFDRPYYFRLG